MDSRATRGIETFRVSEKEPRALDMAVEHLRRGDLVAFPTDTVYGVGAHAFLPRAVALLYAVKERPAHMPIPLLLSTAPVMEDVCSDIPPLAWQLAQRFQ